MSVNAITGSDPIRLRIDVLNLGEISLANEDSSKKCDQTKLKCFQGQVTPLLRVFVLQPLNQPCSALILCSLCQIKAANFLLSPSQ